MQHKKSFRLVRLFRLGGDASTDFKTPKLFFTPSAQRAQSKA
jgi:hypothetical protein